MNFVNEETLFTISPNPSSGNVTITCPDDKNEMVDMMVYDNTGKVVLKSLITIGELEQTSLNLDQVLYSIVVIRGEIRFVRSMIIL